MEMKVYMEDGEYCGEDNDDDNDGNMALAKTICKTTLASIPAARPVDMITSEHEMARNTILVGQ